MTKKYRCPEPSCRKKTITRPRMMLHIWAHCLASEAGLEFSVVEEYLVHHYTAGRLVVDARSGDFTPVDSWSELGGEVGEAIQRVLGEVSAEQRQAQEARRQTRREQLGIEEEAS